MIHGNQKYNFEPLRKIKGEITEKTSNLYSLKASLRKFFAGQLTKTVSDHFEFTEVEPKTFHIKRIA